jgi:hypothetical protein
VTHACEIVAAADALNTRLTTARASLGGNADSGQGSKRAAALITANGTRNFIDATNQIQNRTDAELCLSNQARMAATATMSVDCQR